MNFEVQKLLTTHQHLNLYFTVVIFEFEISFAKPVCFNFVFIKSSYVYLNLKIQKICTDPTVHGNYER